MQKFNTLKSIPAYLPIVNIDTDMIIPKQFLKTIKRTGLGKNLFFEMRYDDQGKEISDFVLNQNPYNGSKILIAGKNFGCGSSREHAPWALLDFGITCVISSSYADIFYSNCFKNGILPIILEEEKIKELSEYANRKEEISVDLNDEKIVYGNNEIKFDVDPFKKKCLLEGLDDIALSLKKSDKIENFETNLKDKNHGFLMIKVKKRKILLLPGDGIGPEVIGEVKKIINWFNDNKSLDFEIDEDLAGGCSYDKHGTPITDEVFYKALESEVVMLGAVGGPKWDNLEFSKKPERALLKLRKELKLFANLRPAICFEQLVDASTLKPEIVSGLDIMIVRELTGGIYFGEPRGIKPIDNGERKGINTHTYTTSEITRVARVAFDLAKKRSNKVTSCEKSNVMEAGQLWKEEVQELHDKEYKDVELSHMLADNCAMQLLRNPKQFDVIVTDNLFGDMLSDQASMLTGSLGLLPSASLGAKNKDGEMRAMYEPIHGSAPDIAGKGLANPIASILSFAMALRYSLDLDNEADALEKAVQDVLNDGLRTKDILSDGMKEASTSEMGDAIISKLQ
jgi:3-isopropylmalate dehydrogenase